ncbi:MAG TPA: hypothetical protein VJG30_01580 [Candidatus Nanoarchaeia archaeon]|nr:hypothetical protein [Candidatus Nanoarchaeia archaeon]
MVNEIKRFWLFLKNKDLEKIFIALIILVFFLITIREYINNGLDSRPKYTDNKIFNIDTSPRESNIDNIHTFINFEDKSGYMEAEISRQNLLHLKLISISIPGNSNITKIELKGNESSLLEKDYFTIENANTLSNGKETSRGIRVKFLKEPNFTSVSIKVYFETYIEPYGYFQFTSDSGKNINYVEDIGFGAPQVWLSEFVLGDYECTLECFAPSSTSDINYIILNNSLITILKYRNERGHLDQRFYLNTYNRKKEDNKQSWLAVYTGLLATLIFEFVIFIISIIKSDNKD